MVDCARHAWKTSKSRSHCESASARPSSRAAAPAKLEARKCTSHPVDSSAPFQNQDRPEN
jgi:hypothetical protein